MDSGDKSEKVIFTSALVKGCSALAGDQSVKVVLPVLLFKGAVHLLVAS
jgi:hypothetical protein